MVSSAAVGETREEVAATSATGGVYSPPPNAPAIRRILESLHLTFQMALPALGSVGLLLVYGDTLLGKLLLFGWLPILVFQLVDFAHHQPPRTTAAALFLALAVPVELVATHALFGDTPLLFFADLFLVELVGMLIALAAVAFLKLVQEIRYDREGLGPFLVLASIGVPVMAWVVLPFWIRRTDDPLFLVGLVIGVAVAIGPRFVAMRAGVVGGDKFATPWMVRGFVLWIVAIFATSIGLP